MEILPVAVIVGLFSAVSTKVPTFQEWDTEKHHQFLGSNVAVCKALKETRQHITRHGKSLVEAAGAIKVNWILQINTYDLDVIRPPLIVMILIHCRISLLRN